MAFLTEGKTNWKYILIVVVLAFIVGGGILWWVEKQEVPPGEFPEIEKIVKLDLSTPEKTFTLYTEAIKNEDFNLIRKLYSKKQQDLVERNINLMQEAVNEGKVLWKAIFFLDREQKDFVVKINSEHSGYVPQIGDRKTYNKLYQIEFNVGSGTYTAYFVNEDGEWRIPGDWDKYDYESIDTSGWKTYRNEEYGFEIKYPEREGITFFKIIVDAEREFLFGTLVCMEGEEATVLEVIRFSPRIEVGASYFEELGRKPTEEECDALAPRFIISGRFCTNKNLTKYQAYCEGGSETSDYHRYDIFLACDGESFKGKEGRIRCNQIFNQILSTFRFLE